MNNYVKIGRESTFGTEASYIKYIDALSEGLKPDNSLKDIEPVISRAKYDALPGEFKATGDIEMVVRPNTILWLLDGVFGAPVTVDNTTYYEHFFYVNNSIPSFTLQIGYDQASVEKEWLGTVFTKISLASKARDLVLATGSVVSKTMNVNAFSAPDFSSMSLATPFTFQGGVVKIGGSTIATIESLTIDSKNGVKEDFIPIGTRTLQGILPGAADVSGSAELVFQNSDLLKQFLGSASATSPQDTLNSTTIQLTYTGPEIGTTGVNMSMDINIPKVYFKTHTANLSKRDIVMEKIDWEAYQGVVTFDSTDYNTPIGVTVTTDAEYPPTS